MGAASARPRLGAGTGTSSTASRPPFMKPFIDVPVSRFLGRGRLATYLPVEMGADSETGWDKS